MPVLSVDIADLQSLLDIDRNLIDRAARAVLADVSPGPAMISIVIVDNQHIHELNRQYLQHDYATDVLSFRLNEPGDVLEGEVIASAEMALQRAPEFGWDAHDELMLYLVHGLLHLIGHEDTTDAQKVEMRQQESAILGTLGIVCPTTSPRLDVPTPEEQS